MQFLKLNLMYARILGYWHITDSLLYKLYTTAQLIFMTLFGFSQMIYLCIHDSSFADKVHIIGSSSVTFLSVYRATVWMYYENKIREMLQFMKDKNFNETDPIILKAHKISFFYAIFLLGFPYISILLTFFPTVQTLLVEKSYVNAKLPYHSWVPFNEYDSKWHFGGALCYQMHGYWCSVSCITVLHVSFLNLMIKIGAHFELLAEEISKINAFRDDAEIQLTHFIQEYHNIYTFAKVIGDINSVAWVGQLFPQAFALCSSLILIASRPANETGGDFFLGISSLFDLFMYCWFGEQIYFQSNRMSIKLSEVNWNVGTLKFRKKFLSTMIVCGHGCTFKIGGFFALRLQSFIQILRLTYSMYTVLKSFTNN